MRRWIHIPHIGGGRPGPAPIPAASSYWGGWPYGGATSVQAHGWWSFPRLPAGDYAFEWTDGGIDMPFRFVVSRGEETLYDSGVRCAPFFSQIAADLGLSVTTPQIVTAIGFGDAPWEGELSAGDPLRIDVYQPMAGTPWHLQRYPGPPPTYPDMTALVVGGSAYNTSTGALITSDAASLGGYTLSSGVYSRDLYWLLSMVGAPSSPTYRPPSGLVAG